MNKKHALLIVVIFFLMIATVLAVQAQEPENGPYTAGSHRVEYQGMLYDFWYIDLGENYTVAKFNPDREEDLDFLDEYGYWDGSYILVENINVDLENGENYFYTVVPVDWETMELVPNWIANHLMPSYTHTNDVARIEVGDEPALRWGGKIWTQGSYALVRYGNEVFSIRPSTAIAKDSFATVAENGYSVSWDDGYSLRNYQIRGLVRAIMEQ